MLSPRLTNCPECSNIPDLLKKINCKLAELGNSLYNNVSYMLNQPIPAGDMLQLIAYKRILTHKYCNPNYVHQYSVAMIASRVIRITAGCVSRCNELERCLEEPCDITIVANPTTTSTSTLPITTTTSTSSTSSTSSTTTTSTTAVPTTTTTSSSSTSTTTSTSSSTSTTTSTSSTTTTTTAYPFACSCLNVNISQTDLDDATGNTPVPGKANNTVYLRASKGSACGGGDIDADYTIAGNDVFCIDLAVALGNIQLFYYKNDLPVYFPTIDSTYTILYSNCSVRGDCEITTTTTTTVEPSTTTTSSSTTGFSLSECAIFINDNNGTIVTYDISTNIVTPLLTTIYSRDIANTTTRIWIYDNATAKIAEYTITLSPWTIVFNRYINYPVGVYLGAGLCAVDNTKLITTNQINLVPNTIIEIDITGSTAIVTDTIATLDTDYLISGDIVLSTTGKVICITQNGFIYKLTQYDRITGVKEVDSDISSYYTTEYPLGLIEDNNKLYILGSSGSVKEVNLSSPYALTLIQTSTFNTSGASSAPQCSTVNLIPPV
jgi:hypothetical protein